MSDKLDDPGDGLEPRTMDRRVRADSQRNTGALLEAALAVFATSGVDAPVREIAVRAGVGVGTVYRHFPQRSDLVVAVFRHEVDACADAAAVLAAEHEPGEALARWMQRYAAFIATKRGLATALHSGDPAFDSLPAYFKKRLLPALRTLLDTAAAAGAVRADIDADDLLSAVASLCMPAMTQGPPMRGAWSPSLSTGCATARAHRRMRIPSSLGGAEGKDCSLQNVAAGDFVKNELDVLTRTSSQHRERKCLAHGLTQREREETTMVQVTVEEASQQLSQLIEEALRGEEVVITNNNAVVARLLPGTSAPRRRPQFGSAKGLIHLSDDIETPLDDFKDYM